MKKSVRRTVALIVGHNVENGDKGAINYLGETESSFNYRIAHKVMCEIERNQRIFPKVFTRDGLGIKGVAKKVAEFNAELSIELHFNSFERPAKGCEALVVEGDFKSIVFADLITDIVSKTFNIKERHGSGVLALNNASRGFKNLSYI